MLRYDSTLHDSTRIECWVNLLSQQERQTSVAIDYLPLLILVVIATGFSIIGVLVPALLGPTKANKQKLEPYESGIIPFNDARRRFPVKYYLVAMLFILFDIEIIFLYPWAGVLRILRDNYSMTLALAPIGFFLLILIVGLLYEWKKGALDLD
jgi:NADH-quinone oxidoreductase subunit A